jgi:transposase
MCDRYINSVHAVFPGATPVIDKAHLYKGAREVFTQIRLALGKQSVKDAVAKFRQAFGAPTDERAAKALESKVAKKAEARRRALNRAHRRLSARFDKLDEKKAASANALLCEFPSLRAHYEFLQCVYRLWDHLLTPEEAQREFEVYRSELDPKAAEAWQPFFSNIERYSMEVWAYFATGLTNSFTEAVHSSIRKIESAGSGLSFETVRNRLLHSHAPSHDAERRNLRQVPILRFPEETTEANPPVNSDVQAPPTRRELRPRPCGRRRKTPPPGAQGELFI